MGTRETVSVRRGDGRGEDLVLEIACEHAAGLLAIARRHSLCADDAHDAYQRAMEILLRRAASLERATALSWMRTVVKHEAMAVRAARQSSVSVADPGLDEREAVALPSADERAVRLDRLARAAEALQRLKPQEVRALLLRAEGHSYEEICSITGWTYTKVNRCLTEGRRAFRARYAAIESGGECERWAPLLSAVADGEADAETVLAVRPHLRACTACRAALRDYRIAPREVAALVPVAALAGAGAPGALSVLVARVHEVVAGVGPQKVQAALDATWSGKVAAIAASTVAIAGGGVAVEREVGRVVRPRPAVERADRAGARHRPPARRTTAAAVQPRSSRGAAAGVVGHPLPVADTRPAPGTTNARRARRSKTRAASAPTRTASPAGEFAPDGPAPASSAPAPTASSASATSARAASAGAPPPAAAASGNGTEFGF
jgi:DNA-directed RNA polymerase specialized sigma24 family protein